MNARGPTFKQTLEPRSRELLRSWLWADQLLYDHFSELFSARVRRFGPERLAGEVRQLRALNRAVRQRCQVAEEEFSSLRGDFKPSSGRVLGFRVADLPECRDLARNELAYVDVLRLKQLTRASHEGGANYLDRDQGPPEDMGETKGGTEDMGTKGGPNYLGTIYPRTQDAAQYLKRVQDRTGYN